MIRQSIFSANQFWTNLLWKKSVNSTRPTSYIINTNSPQYANLAHLWPFLAINTSDAPDVITGRTVGKIVNSSSGIPPFPPITDGYVEDSFTGYCVKASDPEYALFFDSPEAGPDTPPPILMASTSTALTVSFWFYATNNRHTTPSTSDTFFLFQRANANDTWEINIGEDDTEPSIMPGSVLMYLADHAGHFHQIWTNPISINTWHLLHYVQDGTNTIGGKKLYIDGVDATVGSDSDAVNLGVFNWDAYDRELDFLLIDLTGPPTDPNGPSPDSRIADARLYSVALTQNQINLQFDPATRWDLYIKV